MINKIITADVGISGVHFCTLNLEKSVRRILENLRWTLDHKSDHARQARNRAIEQGHTMAPLHGAADASTSPSQQLQALSISPSDASHLAEYGMKHKRGGPSVDGESHGDSGTDGLVPKPRGQNENGTGASGAPTTQEDSWDEFPNGRFTDVRSPAYGEIDGWGNGIKITVSKVHIVYTRSR
jgi:methylenetetrahydrofolate reductase (NADPH)